MSPDLLDLSKIETSEQVDSIEWEKFCTSKEFPNWVNNVVSYGGAKGKTVSSKDLNRVCGLSLKCETVRLGWSMGELYFTRRFQLNLDGV